MAKRSSSIKSELSGGEQPFLTLSHLQHPTGSFLGGNPGSGGKSPIMKVQFVSNWVNNAETESTMAEAADLAASHHIKVTNPSTGQVIAYVQNSTTNQVHAALDASAAAFPGWSGKTLRDRLEILGKCLATLTRHTPKLIALICQEHGKTEAEAAGDVSKGLETFEYALSMPVLLNGASNTMMVSSNVSCADSRQPIGVVASVVPFNFPMMVPFWTLPIALAVGNVVVLKPSEKVPLTMARVAELMASAGLPPGVLNLVHGAAPVAQTLVSSPMVAGVTFVGSTPVARSVYSATCALGKRAICLGGAKNHLVAVRDCDLEMTSSDVTVSFSGCSGQRCMAASVLLLVGEQSELVERIVHKASKLTPGGKPGQMGPVIDAGALAKILGYIQASIDHGAEVLLDGRHWGQASEGYWIGPTILLVKDLAGDPTMHEEIFGPVLSIYVCRDAQEAIDIENANPYGNAACIYTNGGGVAEWFTRRFRAGMLGVNIGVPVPREPFSFGGIQLSKFGHGDITGDGAVEFFTNRIKITTKWAKTDMSNPKNWMS